MTYVRVQTLVQTLSDGTQIKDRVETHCIQDEKGRVRSETAKEFNGSMHLQSVAIFDPVAKENIVLHPRSQVAELRRLTDSPSSLEQHTIERDFREAVKADYAPVEKSRVRFETEKLEPRTLLGERVEGTRQTMVTPVGELGNDRELRSVSEQWASSRLHLSLLNTTDDPVRGRMRDEVVELHLEAPDPGFFLVPQQYRVFDLSTDTTTIK